MGGTSTRTRHAQKGRRPLADSSHSAKHCRSVSFCVTASNWHDKTGFLPDSKWATLRNSGQAVPLYWNFRGSLRFAFSPGQRCQSVSETKLFQTLCGSQAPQARKEQHQAEMAHLGAQMDSASNREAWPVGTS